MSSTNTSRDPTPPRSKDAASDRGRDVRKDAHEDNSAEQRNNHPKRVFPDHGPGEFLQTLDPDTAVRELGELYREWEADK